MFQWERGGLEEEEEEEEDTSTPNTSSWRGTSLSTGTALP
jgi:hypothetical protein